MDSKPIFKSKTVIVNLLVAASGLIPQVREYVAESPETVVTLIAAANIILRTVTKGKVSLFKK